MILTLLVQDGDALADTQAAHKRFGDGCELLVYGGPDKPSLGEAASAARGEYVALLRAGDRLEPGGIAALTGYLAETGDDAAYTNHIAAGAVAYKPSYSRRLLQQVPYPERLVAVRTELALPHLHAEPFSEWAYLSRVLGEARQVGHLGVTAVTMAEPVSREGAEDAIAESLGAAGEADAHLRRGPNGAYRVRARVPEDHLVSVVVPTGTARREVRGEEILLVRNMVESFLATEHPAWEMVLVASEGADLEALEECVTLAPERIRIVPVTGPFNFSGSVNVGVLASGGESVLLLNDDMEITDPAWLTEMLGVVLRPGVGAVGATLLFEDGRIQHIGVVVPPDALPMHPRVFEEPDGREEENLDLEYLAVTGACLLVSREDFLAVGGLPEALPLNFNDVDFCLKLVALGRTNITAGGVRVTHFESSTREARLEDFEIAALDQWRALRLADPHSEYWT